MSNPSHQQSHQSPAEVQSHIQALRAAYKRGNLALYLGAGVSKGNGLPTWSELVLAMSFTAIEGDWKYQWRPFPNYLYAIAEWQLQRRTEPPEITAQKIRQYYKVPAKFFEDLRTTLYVGGNFYGDGRQLRHANRLLDSVSKLCEGSRSEGSGIQAVVTYNYDNLLELATAQSVCKFVPVWRSSAPLQEGERPIFHVHGYIPDRGSSSEPDGIVFTEAQYHAAANDPYSWSNLCQIQCMSSSVGLMVGLSLTDSNMRRLLNALKITPLRKPSFALLKKPEWPTPAPAELEAIHDKAGQYLERFTRSGIKADPNRNNQILKIIQAVNQNEQKVHADMLKELGIEPIWFDEYEQLPGILDSILAQ
jgi:hypothetical protein